MQRGIILWLKVHTIAYDKSVKSIPKLVNGETQKLIVSPRYYFIHKTFRNIPHDICCMPSI